MTPALGSVRGDAAGPTLILVGGLHGNEPAGVEASRRVLARLAPSTVAGEVAAFRGNPPALAAGRRYLTRDLNRQWTPALIAAARSAVDPDPETAALAALADEIDQLLARARGPVFALDLHTTSAEGIPFAIAGGHAADRSFGREIPLPVVVGLQESLGGTLTEYLASRGCVALAVEGGQSESAAAAAHLEAVIVVGLAAAGLAHLPELGMAHETLARARGDLPPRIEVALRQPVGPGFRMVPGFANIERTAAGTLLAHDATGEIRAPFDGLVLMPLYQAQGSDGFFYCREVAA
ncbi:MAG TPA: succinylglutamate desuccinylase/aspartoacylase family protein [Kofleriaceae bacterium]|nr:succinylglutamate desuccinylase/aspartoacylase family protein [Kofleriaceae bacterium]